MPQIKSENGVEMAGMRVQSQLSEEIGEAGKSTLVYFMHISYNKFPNGLLTKSPVEIFCIVRGWDDNNLSEDGQKPRKTTA
jgi:hypothetical protein